MSADAPRERQEAPRERQEAPRFLTLADVAEVLNVTSRQVYALVRSRDLRGIQIGGRGQWRVEAVELEDYIQRQYERTDPAANAASTGKDVRSR